MAKTIATITLSSGDIMDNTISFSNTAELTDAGNDTGVTKTTGLTRITTSSVSNVVLLDSGATGGTEAQSAVTSGKVFIQNLNARGDGSKYVTVLLQAVVIGRLYGGDWAFFPWQGGAGNDIEITPSSTTDTDIEYVAFY
tara:strand:+ start:1764 stop:2183 length:420 start_codon:yes stop_codon:yes gene_type:complete